MPKTTIEGILDVIDLLAKATKAAFMLVIDQLERHEKRIRELEGSLDTLARSAKDRINALEEQVERLDTTCKALDHHLGEHLKGEDERIISWANALSSHESRLFAVEEKQKDFAHGWDTELKALDQLVAEKLNAEMRVRSNNDADIEGKLYAQAKVIAQQDHRIAELEKALRSADIAQHRDELDELHEHVNSLFEHAKALEKRCGDIERQAATYAELVQWKGNAELAIADIAKRVYLLEEETLDETDLKQAFESHMASWKHEAESGDF